MDVDSTASFLELGAGSEFIVRLEELPDDASRVRALLDNEQAPVDVWMDVAKAYFAAGKPHHCEALLKCASSTQLRRMLSPSPSCRSASFSSPKTTTNRAVLKLAGALAARWWI
jgi:hypothetical protein